MCQTMLLDIPQIYFFQSITLSNSSGDIQFRSPSKILYVSKSITVCSWFQAIDTLLPPSLFLSLSCQKWKTSTIAAKCVLAVLLRSVCWTLSELFKGMMICLLHDYEAETQSYLFRDERLLMSCWIFGASIISNAIFEWFELNWIWILQSLFICGCYELISLARKDFIIYFTRVQETVQAALLHTVKVIRNGSMIIFWSW